MKDIKDYDGDYKIDENGDIWSFKYSEPRKLKGWTGSSPYLQIGLSKNNEVSRYLIHRLVAETYLDNPGNLPIVHHKNNNTFDNSPNNLEWTTQQKNIHESYKTMGQVRNFIGVKLYKGDYLIGEFGSQKEACREASKLGASFTSLEKHKQHGEFRLEKV